MPRLVSLAFVITLVPLAFAHEHHEDAIPEGQAVSADPIVSCGINEGTDH